MEDNIIDRLLKSDSMAESGVHAIQWKGTHWRCGCGRTFGDSDADLAAFVGHAPDGSLMVFSSHTDPDIKLAAARACHALSTRIPLPHGQPWLHVPLTSGGKSASIVIPDARTVRNPKGDL